MKTIEIMKATHDCWYGNFQGNKVKLKYHSNIAFRYEQPVYRVSVWGNDDFGMYRDFTDESSAVDMFSSLSKKEVIDKSDLEKLGFEIF